MTAEQVKPFRMRCWCIYCLIPLMVVVAIALHPLRAVAASPTAVFVGYAYSTGGTPGSQFPNPWRQPDGSCGPSCTYVGENSPWDAPAVRLDNGTGTAIAGVNVDVKLNAAHDYSGFAQWHNRTLPAGGQLVVTELTPGTFDLSDVIPPNPPRGVCSPMPDSPLPVVKVTQEGKTYFFVDSDRVMSTGGVDGAGCPLTDHPNDESHQWIQIGSISASVAAAPTGVSATAGAGSATVSFNGVGGTANYRVTPYINGGAQAPVTCAGSPCPVSNLENGTTYLFTVAALPADGVGPESALSNPVATAAGVPGKPTYTAAVGGGASATVLSWLPPNNGGSAVTNYRVTRSDGIVSDVGLGSDHPIWPAYLRSKVLSGQSGTLTYQVAACNASGCGPNSDASSSVTAGVPDAPTNVTVGPCTVPGTVTVSWTAPAENGSPIDSYEVFYYARFTPAQAWEADLLLETFSTQTSFTINGLVDCSKISLYTVAAHNGRGWSAENSFQPLFTGALTSGPAVSSPGANRLDVFARGSDNAAWQKSWDGSGWSSWTSQGGILTATPAAVSWSSNRIDLFVRGTDNALWHKWWDGTAWSPWQSLGGILTSAPAVASWAPGRLDVVVVSADNALWHKWWDGTGWSDWERQGGILTADPAAVSWGFNRIDVFGRGNDNGLWHKWWDGSRWSDWEPHGGILSYGPGVSSWAANRLDVFVVSNDGAMYHRWWDGTRWNGYEGQGGSLNSDVNAVSWGPNRIDVFARGSDNSLSHRWWDGTRWNGWVGAPGPPSG